MENKATDKEIKKALGYCTSVAYRGVCKDCAYVKFKMTDEGCLTPMLKGVLDLINRLEAENERLKYLLEREENKNDVFAKQFYKHGVNEFAERLNKEAENAWIDIEGGFIYSDSDNTAKEIYDTLAEWCKEVADNILKEMVVRDNEGQAAAWGRATLVCLSGKNEGTF